MWKNWGMQLRLQDLLQNLNKVLSVCFIILFVGICTAGCGTEPLAKEQIDEIVVYTSHYAREVPEITAYITDESSITEITQFFDELEYREATEEESPEYYSGGGWDVISFKRNGKVVKQYTIDVIHFCEEEPGSPYINADSDLTIEDMVERIRARKWYILSDEDSITWRGYTDKIINGELGVVESLLDNTPITSALEDMYSSNFTYTVVNTAYSYSGEYTATPYVDHQIYETAEDGFWEEIYYYAGKGSSGDVVSYQGLQDGEWVSGVANRIYVKGYGEDLKVISKKEETIDDKVYAVYSTEYAVQVSKLYGLSEKLEATIKQDYYVEQESGKIVRIVTDCTDSNRMTYIANAMANNDMDLKAAQKKADANGTFEEKENMKIEYQDEDFQLNIPTN